MTDDRLTYYSVIQQAIGLVPLCAESVSWEQLMSLASQQGTLPLLADYALRISGEHAPTTQQKMMMRQVAMQNMLRQQKLRGYLKSVKDALDTAGIPFLLLKGYGLAQLYPNPEVRQSGDVDILVGRKNFNAAKDVLRMLPEVVTYEDQEAEGVRHFNLHWENNQYVVEVHPVAHMFHSDEANHIWESMEENCLSSMETDECVCVDGETYRVPTDSFNVLYVFLHMWHHYLSEGVQMRQLIDWALVLKKRETRSEKQDKELEQLKKNLELIHLMEPWQVFGWLVVNRLGLGSDELPFYCNDASIRAKAELLEKQLWNGHMRDYLSEKALRKGGFVHKLDTLRFIWMDYNATKVVFPQYALYELKESIMTGLKRNLKR